MKFRTRLRSTMMNTLASPGYRSFRQGRARLQRRVAGRDPVVHYFHEVTDPYSHLAVQKLDALRQAYDLDFRVHLTSSAADAYRGDPERYPHWALADAASVAPGYGVHFPADARLPNADAATAAASRLASLLRDGNFAKAAIEVGDDLWRGRAIPARSSTAVFAFGNRLRSRLGHYAGGMFHFEGEWYWGLDRLYHLEDRLLAEGFGSGEILVPRPVVKAPEGRAGDLTLEVFPSLRSPYTAISFDRTLALAERTGIEFRVRPVMPMMMRGVPAPRAKGTYIIFDAAREAAASGVPFGDIVDPFGEPVKRAFSLYPFAAQAGAERRFVSRYLRAAWAEGVDITTDDGLRRIVEDCGLDWNRAQQYLDSSEWEAVLEENVADMLGAGLWGVPSFRVSGGDAPAFSCWGQDRLWRVEQEIAQRTTGRKMP